jgi:hypothetical protein
VQLIKQEAAIGRDGDGGGIIVKHLPPRAAFSRAFYSCGAKDPPSLVQLIQDAVIGRDGDGGEIIVKHLPPRAAFSRAFFPCEAKDPPSVVQLVEKIRHAITS